MHLSPRVRTRTITTVFVITLAAVAAYAAINYKSGPTFSISTFDLVTIGELSGLGGTSSNLCRRLRHQWANSPRQQREIYLQRYGPARGHGEPLSERQLAFRYNFG
jgi:hypothetical protein